MCHSTASQVISYKANCWNKFLKIIQRASPLVKWKYNNWNSGNIGLISRFWVELLWKITTTNINVLTLNDDRYALINASNKPCEKAGSGIRTESSNRREKRRPKNMLRGGVVTNVRYLALPLMRLTCERLRYWNVDYNQ